MMMVVIVVLAGSSAKAGIVAGTLASAHSFTVRTVSFSAAGFSGIFLTLSPDRILVAVENLCKGATGRLVRPYGQDET
jgi:hypothetical protein